MQQQNDVEEVSAAKKVVGEANVTKNVDAQIVEGANAANKVVEEVIAAAKTVNAVKNLV